MLLPEANPLEPPVPIITPLPVRLAEVLVTEQYAGRDSGAIHVSDCIRHLLVTLDPKTYGAEAQADRWEAEGTTRLEIGMAWEVVLGWALSQNAVLASRPLQLWRPGPQVKDSIIGTPDIIGFDEDGGLVVEEWKATWMSCRGCDTDPEALATNPKFWKWLVQVMAYCHMVGSTRAYIRVLFLNGDYSKGKGGSTPTDLHWRLDFTEAELIENWSMIYQAAKAVKAAREREERKSAMLTRRQGV